MDSNLILALCLFAALLPTLIGVVLAGLLERFVHAWAYLIGWISPIILLVGLYAVYVLRTRATPCPPEYSLSCGETTAYALILFIAVMALTAIVNTIAQVVMFLIRRARRPSTTSP